MRVAIVHDWLDTPGGAERVLASLLRLYPDADVYTIVDFMPENRRAEIVGDKAVRSSFIAALPGAKRYFRYYLPLFARAVESFDLKGYDLILSSSWAFAKGAVRGSGAMHICYCHTPVRYAWDLFDEYTAGLPFVMRYAVRAMLRRIRVWDRESSDRVDSFVANSACVAERIAAHYGAKSVVIHPPVDTDFFTLCREKEEYFITASRLVPYKKIDLIAAAFARMPEKRLLIVGDGEEAEAIERAGGANVKLLGYQPADRLAELIGRARAFVFAAHEDFGIAPVEAMACGTPVIAYRRCGTLDSVAEGVSGVFFKEQSVEAIVEAVQNFEPDAFDPVAVREHAEHFSREAFESAMRSHIGKVTAQGGA